MYVCMCVCMCVCMYVCVNMCRCIYDPVIPGDTIMYIKYILIIYKHNYKTNYIQ